MYVCSVTQSCLTLWNLMDCNPPGSSVHGISQTRILEWVAISDSEGSFRDWTQVSSSPALAGRFFATVPSGKPHWLNKHTKLLPHLGLLRFFSLSPAPVSYLQMCASVGILGLSVQPKIPVCFWWYFQSHHPVFYFFVACCSFSHVSSMKTGTISFLLVDMPTTLRTVLEIK